VGEEDEVAGWCCSELRLQVWLPRLQLAAGLEESLVKIRDRLSCPLLILDLLSRGSILQSILAALLPLLYSALGREILTLSERASTMTAVRRYGSVSYGSKASRRR